MLCLKNNIHLESPEYVDLVVVQFSMPAAILFFTILLNIYISCFFEHFR